MYNFQDEDTLVKQVQKFLEDKPQKREIYFYAEELPFPVPEGKVVRVTIDFVSLAKLNNMAES